MYYIDCRLVGWYFRMKRHVGFVLKLFPFGCIEKSLSHFRSLLLVFHQFMSCFFFPHEGSAIVVLVVFVLNIQF